MEAACPSGNRRISAGACCFSSPLVGEDRGGGSKVRAAVAMLLALGAILPARAAAAPSTPNPTPREETKMEHARGEFDVKVNPLPLAGPAEEETVRRMSREKEFIWEVVVTGKRQMLTAGAAEGSGVYVAIETVSATLAGRKGTFALYHRGVMRRGTPELAVLVVPDSGTGELAGISGALNIIIEGKKHFYDLEYSLPALP